MQVSQATVFIKSAGCQILKKPQIFSLHSCHINTAHGYFNAVQNFSLVVTHCFIDSKTDHKKTWALWGGTNVILTKFLELQGKLDIYNFTLSNCTTRTLPIILFDLFKTPVVSC